MNKIIRNTLSPKLMIAAFVAVSFITAPAFGHDGKKGHNKKAEMMMKKDAKKAEMKAHKEACTADPKKCSSDMKDHRKEMKDHRKEMKKRMDD